MAVLATILGPDRTWTSEPLPPGSYAIEVVGRLPGQQLGAPSNRVEFSVDVLDRPETPVDVRVSIVDDVARLSWNPSPTGPAPAAYRLEAAPAGATNFGTVAEALGTEFRAWRIPAGAWQLRVRAVTAGGASDPSPPLAITANRCTISPAAPTVLPITEMVRIVTLRWTPGAGPAADSYVVEVGSNSGMRDLATIATSNPNTVLQTTAPAGRYFIRVRARNACGDSAPSNEVVVIVQ
jgi:predicted phage tail protein